MNGVTVSMALVDVVPVVLFLIAAVLLMRDLYNKMSKGAFALFAAGTLMIVVAGVYKAIWKLLYALNLCDFIALNQVFFPMQTTGFVLTAIALIALLTVRQGNTLAAAAAPLTYESSLIFVVLTVLGLVFLQPILRFLNVPEHLIPVAGPYIFIIIAGLLATFLYDACAAALRALGDTVTPLVILAVSVALNIAGDLLFVLVLKAGVRGAAAATVLAQIHRQNNTPNTWIK